MLLPQSDPFCSGTTSVGRRFHTQPYLDWNLGLVGQAVGAKAEA